MEMKYGFDDLITDCSSLMVRKTVLSLTKPCLEIDETNLHCTSTNI